MDIWLPGYLRSVVARPRRWQSPRHLFVCVADHFEPFRDGASRDQALAVVRRWCNEYPRAVDDFRDADGRPPRHTFFYPQEEYDAECLDRLGELCRAGYGEVEIHLHHRHDTAERLREKLVAFRNLLHERHGLLGAWRVQDSGFKVQDSEDGCEAGALQVQTANREPETSKPRPAYAFIHGNWALCNSRPDGDWCGVNEELGVLAGTGCYADLTFPSAPSATQPRMVNALYRARDVPGRPRGADRGVRCRVAANSESEVQNAADPESLLLIQGPLALNWHRRKWGLLPRLENAELSGSNPPAPARVDLWARQHIHVRGRPEWAFVKLHTHGGVARNADVLLGEAMWRMHVHLRARYNDGQEWKLHYVTARELYNLIRAAEDGRTGAPDPYRDYEIAPPRGG